MYKVFENFVTGSIIIQLELVNGDKVNQYFQTITDDQLEILLLKYKYNTSLFLKHTELDEEFLFDYENCSDNWQDNTNYHFGNYQGI
jgi:hypothetical protein